MPWFQVHIDIPENLMDAVIGELSACGAAGVWEDVANGLCAYFQSAEHVADARSAVGELFKAEGLAVPPFVAEVVQDRDWTEEWKKSYRSFPVGESFYVIPSWSDSPCPPDRIPIHIDPGQAFGTGTHETTQLMMDALEEWISPSQCVLDLGTGSGILAIAARLRGVTHIAACDIDPVAVEVAATNIQRNVPDGVHAFCGSADAVASGVVNLLLCNVTADVIRHIFADIDRVLADRGIAVFSGILMSQVEDMRALVNSAGYRIHAEMNRGEWLALVAEKHGA